MPLVPHHMDPSDAFIKFAKLVWFPKPKDRDFNISQLKSLVSKITKEFETGINFTCPIDQYDEWIMSYETIISDFVSKLVSKKDSLAQPLLLQTGVAGSQGVSLFNRDPFPVTAHWMRIARICNSKVHPFTAGWKSYVNPLLVSIRAVYGPLT